jgi:hypothetical protein
MPRAEPIRCPFCRQRHMPRYLCDPVKALLDEMLAHGKSFDMPTLELTEPLPEADLGMRPGDALVQQLVVKAALVPVAGGVNQPALMFTGSTPYGVLPQWLFANTDEQLRATARLVHDMAELAIRRAG